MSKSETHKEKMERKEMERRNSMEVKVPHKGSDKDEYCLYRASVGEDEKLEYIGVRPTKSLHHENAVIREPDFAMNRFMQTGEIDVWDNLTGVKEKRDLIVDGLRNLTGNQEVDNMGVCVGFGEDEPTHFIVSFTHQGKLINLKGFVADLDTDYHATTMERYHPKPNLRVVK